MTWLQLPDRVYKGKYTIEELADLLFAERSDRIRSIFNTEYVIDVYIIYTMS